MASQAAHAQNDDQPRQLLLSKRNGEFRCFIGFGLYRDSSFRDRLQRRYNSLIIALGNDRERVLNNGLSVAFRQLLQQCDDKSVAFWVIAWNHKSDPVGLKFFTQVSNQAMDSDADDDDEWMDTNRGDIFRNISNSGEPLQQHTIDLQPNQVRLQGIIPSARLPNSPPGLFPVALYGSDAVIRMRPSGVDLLSYGLIRRDGR